MEVAADVGDSWVFRRLGEELARSRWSGLPPWEALQALSTELGLPELAILADIMRLSEQEVPRCTTNLRALQRRHARRDAERRTRQGQRDRRTHVHPDEHPRRHLFGHADLPGTAPPHRRHLMHSAPTTPDHPRIPSPRSWKGPL